MAHDELKSLHTALIDAKNGYGEAAKDAETTALSALFRDMSGMHGVHHGELHKALLAAGEAPDDSGSFMSAVHKGVVSARAAVAGLGGALESFASGEERLVEAYDKAIASSNIPATRKILHRQKAVVLDRIAELRSLAARAERV